MSATSKRVWTAVDRRARLVQQHRLSTATRAKTAEEVGESLVAIHSTDPATVFLSVATRLDHPDPVAELERSLYIDRTLTRMHGMRKTIFVFPIELAPTIQASTTSGHAVRLRFELLRDLALANPEWDESWLAALEAEIIDYLRAIGEASGTVISKAIPNLRNSIVSGLGTKYEVKQGIASRVLRVLGNDYRIARGRPMGTWISGQYRWSLAVPHQDMDVVAARTELVRRWLMRYGPGTLNDLKWWTGWSLRDLRSGMAELDLEEVDLAVGTGYLLASHCEPVPESDPDLALLPGLDSTSMGYHQRDFYLNPDVAAGLFDYAGNIGPTIWWDGRIVGVWAQRKDGELVSRWLTSVPAEAETALQREFLRLSEWLGEIRFTPRYPTPMERELVTQ